ncbi:Uncharacterised protein [Mycobacteroides abscessus subsp. abscessus]|nr:Uncharacterised protein [Mycobacteroides abscessus subsp. abscessus]
MRRASASVGTTHFWPVGSFTWVISTGVTRDRVPGISTVSVSVPFLPVCKASRATVKLSRQRSASTACVSGAVTVPPSARRLRRAAETAMAW